MSDTQDQGQTFDLLERTLATFGADAARWPRDVQSRLPAFIAANRQAQTRLAEARALDKVLEFAPRLSDERSRHLVDEIVARAARQPRVVTGGGAALARPSHFNRLRTHTIAAAALAASLMLGVFAGQNATVGNLTEAMVGGGSTSSQQVAQGDETENLFDEDLL